jgi:F0F1-type ATP synthase membrane subunit a
MSDVWLGVFIGMAVYKTFNTVAAAIIRGTTTTWNTKHIFSNLIQALVFMLLTVLTYVGAIL